MKLALLVLGIVSLIEVQIWLTPLWQWRKFWSGTVSVFLLLVSSLLIIFSFNLWTVLVLVISIYRVINLRRLIIGRTQLDYLYREVRRTSYWLILGQLFELGITAIIYSQKLQKIDLFYALAAVQLATALVLLRSTLRNLHKTNPPSILNNMTDRELPTLSVALPARNENQELEACLQSLTSSTYPKLEILVLDDCSQGKHTAEIIRSFAQKGVRFIAGQAPPDNWLAKNYAYQQLADEANGTLVLFCGVDIRFTPESLRLIVESMLMKKKTMISLIPKNLLPDPAKLKSLIVQPGRYGWELALPRRFLNRPPVLSSCWIIYASTMHAAGGLKAVGRSINPERYFANYALGENDGYSFLKSNAAIGLVSDKSLFDQASTAIRTRYPQLHRRPELVCLLSLAEIFALVAPFGFFLGSIIGHRWILALIFAAASSALITFYAKIVSLTYRHFFINSLWLLPVAAIYDIWLLNFSMWQYEFNEVIWKGRNICLPIMRSNAKLPPNN